MYRIIPDVLVSEQVAALPTDVLPGYAKALDALEVAPWDGEPYHDKNPDGLRCWRFGPRLAGQAVYLILEDQQEVHIVMVQWWG